MEPPQRAADQQRRAEFEAAARQGVVTLMSLDYNKAKEDVQRIIDNSTGEFKKDFQNHAEDFVKVARRVEGGHRDQCDGHRGRVDDR